MTIDAAPTQTPAEAHARAEWRRLRGRLATITPQGLGRGFLAATVAGLGLWVAIGTWPALLPFAIGGVIAYAVLPVVNALNTVLPRGLAALVGVLALLAAVVAVFAIVVPPFAGAVGRLAEVLPTREQLADWIEGVESSIGQAGPAGRLVELIDSFIVGIRDALEDRPTASPTSPRRSCRA